MTGVATRTMSLWIVQPRAVRCVACGGRFVLLARIRAAVSSVGLFVPFETEAHQRDRLGAERDRVIREFGRSPAGIARCPRCRAWQPWMADLARPQAFVIGLVAGAVVGVASMIVVMASMSPGSAWQMKAGIAAAVATALAGAAVAAVLPLLLQMFLHPHSPDRRSMTTEDFARLVAEAERDRLTSGQLWARRLGWQADVPLPLTESPVA